MFIVFSLIILKPQLIFQSFGVKKYLTKNKKKKRKQKAENFLQMLVFQQFFIKNMSKIISLGVKKSLKLDKVIDPRSKTFNKLTVQTVKDVHTNFPRHPEL